MLDNGERDSEWIQHGMDLEGGLWDSGHYMVKSGSWGVPNGSRSDAWPECSAWPGNDPEELASAKVGCAPENTGLAEATERRARVHCPGRWPASSWHRLLGLAVMAS